MLINLTTDIRFNTDDDTLDLSIREALPLVAYGLLRVLDLSELNLDRITSKSNTRAAFSKFTIGALLPSKDAFDREWLSHVFYCWTHFAAHTFQRLHFEEVFRCSQHPTLVYTKNLARNAFPGMGMLLVRLHATKVITLPATFHWPSKRDDYPFDLLSREMCAPSELLSFFRSLVPPNLQREEGSDDAFGRNSTNQYRAEWLGTRGTKVLLALGWHSPEDMNLAECVKISKVIKEVRLLKALTGTMSTLLNVIKAKFGDRAPLDGGAWMSDRRTVIHEAQRSKSHSTFSEKITHSIIQKTSDFSSLYKALVEASQSAGNFENFKRRYDARETRFSGNYDFTTWFKLHEVYFKMKKFEAKKKRKNSLGVLGLYLFYYLPAWFDAHPDTILEYPTEPNKLVAGVFLTRWIDSEQVLPIPFIDFVRARADALEHTGQSHYTLLNQVKAFFDFLEENAALLIGCENFKNQFVAYDFPSSSRPQITNKRAIPRRMFAPYIQYVWAIKSYFDLVVDRMLDETLASDKFDRLSRPLSVIDTYSETANSMGYIPVIFYDKRCIPVRYIPYVPVSAWYKLKDGRYLKLACPHAINQILCALITGLRHNHIQWLDARNFDRFVKDDDEQFTQLYMNTDKVKKTGWTPEVNIEAIQILRSQKKWRDLISSDAFDELHFYNGNEDSSYDPILPLFSYGPSGMPHDDNLYMLAWFDILAGFQGFAVDLFGDTEIARKNLVKFLPPKVYYDLENLAEAQQEWSSTEGLVLEDNPRVKLIPRSNITPHSSRVSVVTHSMTFLPPDVIGQYLTGQTAATVLHYYKPEPEVDRVALAHQGMHMRDLALQQQAVEAITAPNESSVHHIQADVNSALARSIKFNLEGTIADYGCISLIMRNEDQPGIDVLRDRGIGSIAFNKTEICPYDNNCPESVIKMLRGMRRCSLCPAAVRSIDHLPAIAAKKKQMVEIILAIDRKLDAVDATKKYTDTDLDLLERDRQRHAEDIAGWEASEQMLEAQRSRIAAGADERRWLVEKPEIIREDLQKVETPSSGASYLATRLAECVSYPGFQSETIKSMLDIARRRILASVGQLDAALSTTIPVDPAAECAGLIRSLVEANGLTTNDVIGLLDTEKHLELTTKPSVLGIGYDEAAY